jgi:hypothetical protein
MEMELLQQTARETAKIANQQISKEFQKAKSKKLRPP